MKKTMFEQILHKMLHDNKGKKKKNQQHRTKEITQN